MVMDISRNKKRVTNCIISEVPDHILVKILIRLPLKAIFTSKCICKRWNSLISSPFFASSFVGRLDEALLPPWDLLYRYMHNNGGGIPTQFMHLHVTFKQHPEFKSNKFSLDFLQRHQQQDYPINVLATSNGLFLCCDSVFWQNKYYVCNPLTAQWVSLPKPPCTHKSVNVGFTCRQHDGGYILVRIIELTSLSTLINMEIFSSDMGAWRAVNVSSPEHVCLFQGAHHRAMLYNGIMHWLALPNALIAYHPNSNSNVCRLINLPNDVMSRCCRAFGTPCGRLRYIRVDDMSTYGRDASLSVWALNNYDAGEWCLEFNTPVADILSHNGYVNRPSGLNLTPLAFHPLEMDIVFLSGASCIIAYNLRTKRLKAVTDEFFPGGVVSHAVVFPFVLPPWPTPVPRPTWYGGIFELEVQENQGLEGTGGNFLFDDFHQLMDIQQDYLFPENQENQPIAARDLEVEELLEVDLYGLVDLFEGRLIN